MEASTFLGCIDAMLENIIHGVLEGFYDDDDIVAEDKVTSALSNLNLTSSSSTIAISNQQMARRCLLSK
jgi:hypothetical protein